MTNLHIEAFDNNGIQKWGIFYDDDKGVHRALTENFKALIYENMGEAQIKLDAMESERQREDSALPFSLEEAREFAGGHKWKYATTYAKTAPHSVDEKSIVASFGEKKLQLGLPLCIANDIISFDFPEYAEMADKYRAVLKRHNNIPQALGVAANNFEPYEDYLE